MKIKILYILSIFNFLIINAFKITNKTNRSFKISIFTRASHSDKNYNRLRKKLKKNSQFEYSDFKYLERILIIDKSYTPSEFININFNLCEGYCSSIEFLPFTQNNQETGFYVSDGRGRILAGMRQT